MEELKYVIEDSTIAELLGVQNFSTDEAAILELVKNAYDANALNLKITFQNDTLRFEDNGIGMNADDIKKHWMHIGKSSKEYEIIDEKGPDHAKIFVSQVEWNGKKLAIGEGKSKKIAEMEAARKALELLK